MLTYFLTADQEVLQWSPDTPPPQKHGNTDKKNIAGTFAVFFFLFVCFFLFMFSKLKAETHIILRNIKRKCMRMIGIFLLSYSWYNPITVHRCTMPACVNFGPYPYYQTSQFPTDFFFFFFCVNGLFGSQPQYTGYLVFLFLQQTANSTEKSGIKTHQWEAFA